MKIIYRKWSRESIYKKNAKVLSINQESLEKNRIEMLFPQSEECGNNWQNDISLNYDFIHTII